MNTRRTINVRTSEGKDDQQISNTQFISSGDLSQLVQLQKKALRRQQKGESWNENLKCKRELWNQSIIQDVILDQFNLHNDLFSNSQHYSYGWGC